jgi:hypothetical protein
MPKGGVISDERHEHTAMTARFRRYLVTFDIVTDPEVGQAKVEADMKKRRAVQALANTWVVWSQLDPRGLLMELVQNGTLAPTDRALVAELEGAHFQNLLGDIRDGG